MKTRDRILHTSRTLFNEEGEADQSAVDIAHALGISPGNLYYHFKGKDAIIHALFDMFEDEMMIILRGSRGAITSIQDSWIYTYIIFEEIYDFRFFYRNLGALLARYPNLASRFGRLLREKRKSIRGWLDDLCAADLVSIAPGMSEMLEEQMLMTATCWLSMDQIEGNKLSSKHLIHKTVYQMMTLLVPYMGEAGFAALKAMDAYYTTAIKETE
jgi:AcrR family transcriptional regulator